MVCLFVVSIRFRSLLFYMLLLIAYAMFPFVTPLVVAILANLPLEAVPRITE